MYLSGDMPIFIFRLSQGEMMKKCLLCTVVWVLLLSFFSMNALGAAASGKTVIKNKSQPLPIKVSPGQTALPAVSGIPSDFPSIQSVAPNVLTPGQTGTLTVIGQNLTTGMKVRLGDGITTGTPSMLTDKRTRVSVAFTVGTDALPGTRFVHIQYQDRVVQTPVPVTVVGAAAPPAGQPLLPGGITLKPQPGMTRSPLSAVIVQAVYPNQWARGKSYAVTVQGNRFSRGLQVDLGKDIEVQKLKVASPTRLTMTVAVGDDAAALGPCSFKVKTRTDAKMDARLRLRPGVVAPPKMERHQAKAQTGDGSAEADPGIKGPHQPHCPGGLPQRRPVL